MKKPFLIFLIFLIFFGKLDVCYSASIYPSSDDFAEFSQQAEQFIISRSQSGDGLKNINDRTDENLLKEDKRDWEAVLARMINDPDKYGIGTSGVAFDASVLRGTARNPEVVSASERLLVAHISAVEKSYEQFASQGNPRHPFMRKNFPSMVAQLLEVGAPEHLLSILAYLNSPSEERIGLIELKTPGYVASALRTYGDKRHVAEAAKFAKKLREAGKNDIADDISRSIKHIEKEGDKSDSSGAVAPNVADERKTDAGKSKIEGIASPWIIGSIVAGITLIFVIFKIVRRRSPR